DSEGRIYAKASQLYAALPCALCLLVVRYLFERFLATPLATVCGVKDRVRVTADPNPLLENYFSTKTRFPSQADVRSLCKKTSWPERRVQVWFRRRRNQERPGLRKRFCEASWRCVFYFFAFVYGVLALYDKPWLYNLKEVWAGFPKQSMLPSQYWYYLLEMGFYLSLLLSLTFDVKRKDFKEQVIHHFATLTLLTFSWISNYIRIGTLVMAIHDSADILLEGAKVFNYAKWHKTTNAMFVVFTVIFTASRLVIFPFWLIHCTWVYPLEMFPPFFGYYFFNVMLLVLQMLHLYWAVLISRMLYKFIFSKVWKAMTGAMKRRQTATRRGRGTTNLVTRQMALEPEAGLMATDTCRLTETEKKDKWTADACTDGCTSAPSHDQLSRELTEDTVAMGTCTQTGHLLYSAAVVWTCQIIHMLMFFKDAKKEYLEKKERGELLAQKVDFLKQNMLRPVNFTVTNDGSLHFGDVVMMVNMGSQSRACSALSINADVNSLTKGTSPGIQAPCGISAGRSVQACTRTAFIITRIKLCLTSDLQSFQKCAKKSRLQEVNLDDGCSFLSWWKVVHFDPQERLEYEGLPVPANVKVLIVHCKTNQALAVLGDQVLCYVPLSFFKRKCFPHFKMNVPGLVAVVVFYIVILVIGIWASRKSKKVEDICTGSKSEVTIVGGCKINVLVGVFTMTSSISHLVTFCALLLATWVGGGYILGTAEAVDSPSQGLIWAIGPPAYLINFLLGGTMSVILGLSHRYHPALLHLHQPGKKQRSAEGEYTEGALYQRILSAASSAQAQVTCFTAAGMVFIVGIPSVVIGAVAASAVMSSMDSVLLYSASMFTQNIYKTTLRKQQASGPEMQRVIRISVLLVGLEWTGLAGTGLAFGDNSVFALWLLSGDLLYCVLRFSCTNSYGAISGYVVGLQLRALSGEPVLGIPPLILYPGWREEQRYHP
ncbi:hypothetical protein L3Q82_023961, partial [Scortum barcoo]